MTPKDELPSEREGPLYRVADVLGCVTAFAWRTESFPARRGAYRLEVCVRLFHDKVPHGLDPGDAGGDLAGSGLRLSIVDEAAKLDNVLVSTPICKVFKPGSARMAVLTFEVIAASSIYSPVLSVARLDEVQPAIIATIARAANTRINDVFFMAACLRELHEGAAKSGRERLLPAFASPVTFVPLLEKKGKHLPNRSLRRVRFRSPCDRPRRSASRAPLSPAVRRPSPRW
jgi:hypothetical protein